MNEVEKNMAVSALAQLLDQQPTAYAEVLAACRAMGWNASPTAQPADIIDELPSNVLPFIRRMLALLIYGDGSADSPAVVPVTERCYAQLVPRVTSPNYPAAGFQTAPSALSPMTPSIRDFAHLEQALSALSPRKITNGNATNDGIADGMSLAHLIFEGTATEIKDDNLAWKLSGILSKLAGVFPLASKVTLNCEEIEFSNNDGFLKGASSVKQLFMPYLKKMVNHYGWYNGYGFSDGGLESLYLPKFEEYSCDHYGRLYAADSSIKYVDFPAFRKMSVAHGLYMFSDCPELLEVNVPSFSEIVYNGAWYSFITNCPKIRKVVVGKLAQGFPISGEHPDLIDFTIGENYDISLNMSTWSPTLDSSNLDQFLQNFRSHIALRLTDNGSNLTLTLSQAVYDAIKDETHLFVFDEGTMTIYAYLTNIKHWTVTK